MENSALILMIATQLTVTSFTAFFFYKVLTNKKKP